MTMGRKILTTLFAYVPAGFVAASILLVVLLRFVPVGCTPLMVKRALRTAGDRSVRVEYRWVPLEDVSEAMIAAVVAAEDARFWHHGGFDFQELEAMRRQVLYDGSPVRGCSTISQQTAKNCFTLCSRTWARKVLEAYYTVLIERLWGKRRILEVYLNVAEMGPGIYGAEAAAWHFFHVSASELTAADAASLACCLPNPLHRNPDWANAHMAGRRAQIAGAASRVRLPEGI